MAPGVGRVARMGTTERPSGETVTAAVTGLITAAVVAFSHGQGRVFGAAIDDLVTRPDLDGWRGTVERELTAQLTGAVEVAWQRGWQPADVARAVGRRFTTAHVQLAAAAVAAQLQGFAPVTLDPRWPGQLAEMEAVVSWPADRTFLRARYESPRSDWVGVTTAAVEVLAVLTCLPTLEKLGPLPGTARPPAKKRGPGSPGAGAEPAAPDERVLSRIRALLAKAESTGYPAEAEAFTAAAQERMARHSIDAAMLAATAPETAGGPAGRRIGVDNPYESAKAVLLDAVAGANRCRSVWSRKLGFCTVIGFESDLDAVDALFTSLLVQATAAMTRAGSRTGAGGRSRTRAFRQSFLMAYAARIGERLAGITRAETEAAAAEPGQGDLLPVLASREAAVEDTLATLFPTLTQTSASAVTDAEGYWSGRGAADLARLGSGTELRE